MTKATGGAQELIAAIEQLVDSVCYRHRVATEAVEVILHPDDKAKIAAYETHQGLYPGAVSQRYGSVTYSIKSAPGRPTVFAAERYRHFTLTDFE
ncbi:hypothetical protein [Streptomyces noursei]